MVRRGGGGSLYYIYFLFIALSTASRSTTFFLPCTCASGMVFKGAKTRFAFPVKVVLTVECATLKSRLEQSQLAMCCGLEFG